MISATLNLKCTAIPISEAAEPDQLDHNFGSCSLASTKPPHAAGPAQSSFVMAWLGNSLEIEAGMPHRGY